MAYMGMIDIHADKSENEWFLFSWGKTDSPLVIEQATIDPSD